MFRAKSPYLNYFGNKLGSIGFTLHKLVQSQEVPHEEIGRLKNIECGLDNGSAWFGSNQIMPLGPSPRINEERSRKEMSNKEKQPMISEEIGLTKEEERELRELEKIDHENDGYLSLAESEPNNEEENEMNDEDRNMTKRKYGEIKQAQLPYNKEIESITIQNKTNGIRRGVTKINSKEGRTTFEPETRGTFLHEKPTKKTK